MSKRGELEHGWHPVDAVSLVAGLAAVAVAVGSLAGAEPDGRVLLAALLVVAGALGLVGALRGRDDRAA